jgi:hypothetical protein
MNLMMMCNYMKFCAYQLLLTILQDKTFFFKKQVGEYSISGIGVNRADQSFALP